MFYHRRHHLCRMICINTRKGALDIMSITELLLIAIGLSMDAFAVSICKGLSVSKMKLRHALICGAWFGLFQAIMPTLGFLLGRQFEKYITSFDHWIAFGLLLIIGGNMIREALSKEEEKVDSSFSAKALFPLAVATSIDALAVGVSFAFLGIGTRIIPAVIFIGVITFLFSMLGVKLGNLFGTKYKSAAEITGGIVLILIGLKILLEHLGVINF